MRFPNPLTFAKAVLHWARRPEIAPDFVRRERIARCAACTYYEHGQCQVCTCLVSVKTLLATERCPAKSPRWGEYYSRWRTGIGLSPTT